MSTNRLDLTACTERPGCGKLWGCGRLCDTNWVYQSVTVIRHESTHVPSLTPSLAFDCISLNGLRGIVYAVWGLHCVCVVSGAGLGGLML
jgi:hypothetical protein